MLDAEIRISVDVDMPAPPGLRYVCDSGPAIPRRRAGKGFALFRCEGQAGRERRHASAHTLARHPAGMDRCLDLRVGERAHSGDRPRRQRAQAIQISRRISRGARAIEIRALVRVRRGAADDPGDGRRAHEPARAAAREGSGDGRASLGEDADPRRQRRICAKQSELWTHHSQKRSRRGRGLRGSFPVHGQERQAMVARDARPARGADRPGLPGAAWTGSSAIFQRGEGVARGLVRRRQRLSSERSPAATSPPRTFAPGPGRC